MCYEALPVVPHFGLGTRVLPIAFKRRSGGVGSLLDFVWSLQEKTCIAPKSLAHYLQLRGGEVGLESPSLDNCSALTVQPSAFSRSQKIC